MSKYDEIIEVHDEIEEVEKFNPYHDALGRFSSGGAATSFTFRTNSPAGQKAIANIRAKQLTAGGGESTAASKPKESKQNVRENQEQVDRVKKFEDDLIAELKRDINPKFRDEFNTLHDLLNDREMERDINRVKTSVENNDKQEMERLKKEFTKTSEHLAQSWFDEDLGIVREGWTWESNFYKKLADLCEQRR